MVELTQTKEVYQQRITDGYAYNRAEFDTLRSFGLRFNVHEPLATAHICFLFVVHP